MNFTVPQKYQLAFLLAACALIRLTTIGLNEAEYTDGVLQVIQFERPTGIWPPLYTALVWPAAQLIGDLWSGRLVSAIASTLAIIPLFALARRCYGDKAAWFASLFYLVAPVANRWGIRMMTDATFSLFFFIACERIVAAFEEQSPERSTRALAMGTVAAVCATLTRYQGLLFLPVLVFLVGYSAKRFKEVPVLPILLGLGFLLLPLWSVLNGFIHGDQFSERTEASPMATWKVLALNGEAFVLLLPYFLTYTTSVFVLWGFFKPSAPHRVGFPVLTLYVAVALLVAQSAFSSFQERYLLPLMGLLWVFAGAGFAQLSTAWAESSSAWCRRAFPYVALVVFGWSSLFSVMVLVGQRQAFGDIAIASRAAGDLLEGDAELFTNEIYKAQPLIASDKVAFFSSKDVRYLGTDAASLEPGDLLVLSAIYGEEIFLQNLSRNYRIVRVPEEELGIANPITSSVLPILPEIMSQPGTAQNPTAWIFRYEWQTFSSTVYRVEARR